MFKPNQSILYLNILLLLLCTVHTYKQFQLERSTLNEYNPCTTQQQSQQVYQQICYYKDVSYHTQIFIDQIIYYVSMDLTLPYSWMKSPNCKNGQDQNCHIIQNQQKKEARIFFKDVKAKYNLFSRYHDGVHQKSVAIVGSSDKIIGQTQEIKYGQIYAKDPKNSRYLSKLIGISLFLTSQKDTISLRDISLIKTNRISKEINEMIDGAISLKVSRNIPNNLLQQIFINSQSSQRFVTIFIHPLSRSGVISIGDLSFKNTKSKSSQILWVQMKNNAKYGQFTQANALTLSSVNSQKDKRIKHNQLIFNFTKNIYYTISSSFIYLPRDCLDWLTKSLQEQTNAICQLPTETGIFKCRWRSMEDKKQALYMKLSFNLNHKKEVTIPFTTLVKMSNSLYMQFTIKQNLLGHIILGEPFFQQYLVFIDYAHYKMGFSQPFYHQSDKYTSILIYFLRFILFSTIILFLFYICWRPFHKIKRFLEAKLSNKTKGGKIKYYIPDQETFLQ